jgi:hypothetical protein
MTPLLPLPVRSHRVTHIKKILTTEWKLPIEVIDSALLHHFIQYWNSEYFWQKEEDGIIYKDGRVFKICYHHCSILDCMALSRTDQIALSFRVPKHTFEGLMPIVLVSCNRSTIHSTKRK